MKRIRFADEQIIGVLCEVEAGAKTSNLACKHGVSEVTLYNWKSKYGGLEMENTQLKKSLADAMLDNAGLKVLLSKKWWRLLQGVKRCCIFRHYLMSASGGRAADCKSMRYQSRRGDDVELREKLRALAQERRRLRIAGGYVTQSLASRTQSSNNDARTLIANG